MKKYSNSVRLFFFGIGLAAVLALTGLNVYSLYELRESTISSARDIKKNQLEEFSTEVRTRFLRPGFLIRRLDIVHIQEVFNETGDLPYKVKEIIHEASTDSLFLDIYYSSETEDGCVDPAFPIFKYDNFTGSFRVSDNTPRSVCDGMNLSRSQIRARLADDYRWTIKFTFDSYRTMTLSLINVDERRVIGYLTFVINNDYLINDFLGPELVNNFGPNSDSGMVVWLRDWISDEILYSSDDRFTYKRGDIDFRQRFPEMLDTWILHAKYVESPTVTASNASLIRNLIVLGIAVFVLFSALVFMYFTAKKERELAHRQAGFLANVTHELKTPLAVMQAAGENISDGRVTDGKRLKAYGEHIYNESIRLKKMIEKLLDVAKSDSGQAMVNPAAWNLSELAANYVKENEAYIKQKGFKLELNAPKTVPLALVDAENVETILNNLVENAIKYSPDQKYVGITVKHNGNHVQLSVSDKGIGIPSKAHKYIFDRFYRVEDALTARTKGHGLGLSIVKNMVDLNGGTIHVKSEPGKGSVFTVSFPVMLEGTESIPKESAQSNKQTLAQVSEYVHE
jgi:signal transduction histidine kinase